MDFCWLASRLGGRSLIAGFAGGVRGLTLEGTCPSEADLNACLGKDLRSLRNSKGKILGTYGLALCHADRSKVTKDKHSNLMQ